MTEDEEAIEESTEESAEESSEPVKSQARAPVKKGPEILYKSSKDFYRAMAKQWGITCKMSDNCRCLDCQVIIPPGGPSPHPSFAPSFNNAFLQFILLKR